MEPAKPTLKLGDTEVARVGLGTNRLTQTPEHVAFVKEAVAAGVNLIDTAHTYTGGQSEETIGAALSPLRDECVVATKGGWGGGRPEVLRAEIDESLRRLRIETIPLYYLHRVDPQTPLEESLGAIKEYRDSGKIRDAGVSNVGIDQIEQARQVMPIATVQNRYNLADRTYDDVVDYCAGDGGRALADIAKRRGATWAQVVLAWLLRRSPTVLPIPGTLSLEHLKENLAALEIEFSEAEFRALL
jgi:pyridoxine 4-dehydrogenase